jgi:serine/threonine-protein kinase ATR
MMASLQSTLGISELREETLRTWNEFIRTLRFSDVGQFIGRTSGALVAHWPSFTEAERGLALSIINYIADNAASFGKYLDDVVGLAAIPELVKAGHTLDLHRKRYSFEEQLTNLLDRTQSSNTAVATMSMKELKRMLDTHMEKISQMCRGDTFDSLVSLVLKSLLVNATRDGECQDLRDLSHECIGLIGALDPDRIVPIPDNVTMTLMSNFADGEEAIDFAIHIVSGLLADAFRATNDMKHQAHLAYAIQELLRFCNFNAKIVQGGNVPLKTRQKWEKIPAYQHETLAPLLEGQFTVTELPSKTYPHPIYSSVPTYREWLQNWTHDLLDRVMANPKKDIATYNSQIIFGVCRGVLRNQDVTVANHLLPHIVLNVLLIGDDDMCREICEEINTVLQDQVNPSGSLDKRSLSAQVIFDLMDHLSKWLRLQRQKGDRERGKDRAIVDKVLSSIDTELMANAALQSRAYARSLRSFEQRILQLRGERRRTADLQTYYERLHQIYAELDEPDGMEGVSTSVISPSLEHQIREHESTGRWTSAQSCWEVRLQQSPEDVKLHVGLLKCLRNLGHYGELFDVSG